MTTAKTTELESVQIEVKLDATASQTDAGKIRTLIEKATGKPLDGVFASKDWITPDRDIRAADGTLLSRMYQGNLTVLSNGLWLWNHERYDYYQPQPGWYEFELKNRAGSRLEILKVTSESSWSCNARKEFQEAGTYRVPPFEDIWDAGFRVTPSFWRPC